MSMDNPKSPISQDEHPSSDVADEQAERKQDAGGAGEFAAEVLVNGAEMVIDGVGTVISSVFSSLGDLG